MNFTVFHEFTVFEKSLQKRYRKLADRGVATLVSQMVSHMMHRGFLLVWPKMPQNHCFVNNLIKYTVLSNLQKGPSSQVLMLLFINVLTESTVPCWSVRSQKYRLVSTCVSKHSLVNSLETANQRGVPGDTAGRDTVALRCGTWWVVGTGYWYRVGSGTGYRVWFLASLPHCLASLPHCLVSLPHCLVSCLIASLPGLQFSSLSSQVSGLSSQVSGSQCQGLRVSVSGSQVSQCHSVTVSESPSATPA